MRTDFPTQTAAAAAAAMAADNDDKACVLNRCARSWYAVWRHRFHGNTTATRNYCCAQSKSRIHWAEHQLTSSFYKKLGCRWQKTRRSGGCLAAQLQTIKTVQHLVSNRLDLCSCLLALFIQVMKTWLTHRRKLRMRNRDVLLLLVQLFVNFNTRCTCWHADAPQLYIQRESLSSINQSMNESINQHFLVGLSSGTTAGPPETVSWCPACNQERLPEQVCLEEATKCGQSPCWCDVTSSGMSFEFFFLDGLDAFVELTAHFLL